MNKELETLMRDCLKTAGEQMKSLTVISSVGYLHDNQSTKFVDIALELFRAHVVLGKCFDDQGVHYQ